MVFPQILRTETLKEFFMWSLYDKDRMLGYYLVVCPLSILVAEDSVKLGPILATSETT